MSKDLTFDDFLKEQLQDRRLAILYLQECLAYRDINLCKKALKAVANAQIARLRKDT